MTLGPRDIDELLGAWALGALEPEEAAEIDAAIEQDAELASAATELLGALASLGDLTAANPRVPLRDELLSRVAALPRPATEATDPVTLFDHQVRALERLLAELRETDWRQPASPYAWTVHGLVAHLLVIDRYMAGQLGLDVATSPDRSHHLAMGRDVIAAELHRPPSDTAAAWSGRASATIDALRRGEGRRLDAAVEFHRWPFTVSTLLIARAFEVWTHTDDIRRATGRPVDAPAPEDLRSMSQFSVTSLPLVLPLVADGAEFGGARVVLTGRGGGTFDLGDAAHRDALVVADVVDYCRLAARRLELDAIDVTIEGDRAVGELLLTAARVFAV